MIGLDPFLCDFMTFDITGAISPFLVVPQRIILKLRADYSNFLPLLAVSYANFSQHFGECIVYKSQLFKKKRLIYIMKIYIWPTALFCFHQR